MTSLSVNRWGFTDKLFEINNLSGKRRVFTDKITFCETTINRNSSLGQSPNEKHGDLTLFYHLVVILFARERFRERDGRIA